MRIFLVLVILFLSAPFSDAAFIEGRIVAADEPVAGLRVFLYRTLDFDAEPLFISEPSDGEGYYRVEVTPGTYALFASHPGRRLFAFCGRNPVRVDQGTVWAGLQAVKTRPNEILPYADEYSAAVEGRVLYDGKPLAGAYVYLYLDPSEDLKGQGYRMSMPTGPDGRFAFDGLPESSYYLMARKRQDGSRVGPVREEDFLGHFAGNPVVARAGTSTRVTIPTVRKVRDEPGSETFNQGTGPVVEGRVVDRQNKPVANVHVFAYTDRVIGHKRPAALSTPTGPDGRFRLQLDEVGTYYIGAREEYGDSPAPGELFGMYDETADHGLEVEAGGSPDGIEIVVEPISLQ